MPRLPLFVRLIIDIIAMASVLFVDYGTLYLLYVMPLGDILRGWSIVVSSGVAFLYGLAYIFLARERLFFLPEQNADNEMEATPLQKDRQQALQRLTVPLYRTSQDAPKPTVQLIPKQ